MTMNKYEAIVVGGGHAGVEAAYSLASRGLKTLLITIKKSHIAAMPCNPSIGGPAKGIVVKEIDALGGIMPRVADTTALQFKMLNTTKGPGVRALRVQSDKLEYAKKMQEILDKKENLDILEDLVEEVLIEDEKVIGVRTKDKSIYSKVTILTTGTYMDSLIMVSDKVRAEGPYGDKTTKNLSASLKKAGLKLFRLKTGTPPRIKTDSIDFSKTKKEPGSKERLYFSETSKDLLPYEKQWPCYLTYTSEKTLKIIRDNLKRSSMYSGVVKGVGPRYCPSIEDKVVRFSDKERHQIFLEPESRSLDTTYVQGFSTSMPYEVQEKMVKSIIGLENAKIDKYAYAIEYDAIDPLEVKSNLECKKIANLFIAGQILGTSGYEEAAGLGLMAGINAGLKLEGKEPLILRRDEAYIGVMIDDLVTKGTKEPYRLLTSRAEYRLLLRHDNADTRLEKYGYEYNSLDKKRYEAFLKRMEDLEKIKEELNNTTLRQKDFPELEKGMSAIEYIKRPENDILKLAKDLGLDYDEDLLKRAEIEIKYAGYIEKAKKEARRMQKMEFMKLEGDIDYNSIMNLSLEARQKLSIVKPKTLGQAMRISGINPSDIQVLALYQKERSNEDRRSNQ